MRWYYQRHSNYPAETYIYIYTCVLCNVVNKLPDFLFFFVTSGNRCKKVPSKVIPTAISWFETAGYKNAA